MPVFFPRLFNELVAKRPPNRHPEAPRWGAIEGPCTDDVRSSGARGTALIHRARLERGRVPMSPTPLLEDLSARISEFLAASPAKDLEKNLRALLGATFARLNLATREELEIQAKVLARTREKLAELERRVAEFRSEERRVGKGCRS